MKNFLNKNFLPILVIIGVILFFFKPLFLQNKLPIPADTIIGLYHPFRDLYAKEYPNGIPFKNSLVTDPVRQQYPWRELAISLEKKVQLPLWNPYSFSGTPLLANFQSAVFYPLNVVFYLVPFDIAWATLTFSQPLLAGLFLFLYLNHLKLNKWASALGALAFSFSGFSIAWMEWNTIMQTALWLPLILLSIDKIFIYTQSSNSKFKIQKHLIWMLVLIVSLCSSFFAGHLQTFFYLFIVVLAHFFFRWIQFGKDKKIFWLFVALALLFILITSVQWLSTAQFILESARGVDQADWQKEGWFIPWQNLIQFVAPDFFGNPTTLNYWGIWNYGEFIGYIGIFPLVMAIFSIFFRKDKQTLFFGSLFFLSLIFALPTIFAKLPYIFGIPFLSSSQPTRLLFLTDFSLAVLPALGFDYFLKNKKNIFFPLLFLGIIFVGLWFFVIYGNSIKLTSAESLLVTKNNLFLPTIIFSSVSFLLIFLWRFKKTTQYVTIMIYIIIVGITVFDLLRFGTKFTPFTNKDYLFPSTKTIEFLKNNLGNYRIASIDSRILPPNFSTIYRLQNVEGYDPLYAQRYGELIAASERGKPDINPPFGFNRIITPHNYDSKIIDLLGVKYVLSLSDINSPKFKKVFQEGQTRVYENKEVLPRIFFVENLKRICLKEDAIEALFDKNLDVQKSAAVEDCLTWHPEPISIGKTTLLNYSENNIVIKTENKGDGFLVLTDSFYPTWKVRIDGVESKIYRTNYNFRGVFVPKGNHMVEFYITLL